MADRGYLEASWFDPQCRGVVSGNDWMREDLQARYAGHFLPYISRRIAAVKS